MYIIGEKYRKYDRRGDHEPKATSDMKQVWEWARETAKL